MFGVENLTVDLLKCFAGHSGSRLYTDLNIDYLSARTLYKDPSPRFELGLSRIDNGYHLNEFRIKIQEALFYLSIKSNANKLNFMHV